MFWPNRVAFASRWVWFIGLHDICIWPTGKNFPTGINWEGFCFNLSVGWGRWMCPCWLAWLLGICTEGHGVASELAQANAEVTKATWKRQSEQRKIPSESNMHGFFLPNMQVHMWNSYDFVWIHIIYGIFLMYGCLMMFVYFMKLASTTRIFFPKKADTAACGRLLALEAGRFWKLPTGSLHLRSPKMLGDFHVCQLLGGTFFPKNHLKSWRSIKVSYLRKCESDKNWSS